MYVLDKFWANNGFLFVLKSSLKILNLFASFLLFCGYRMFSISVGSCLYKVFYWISYLTNCDHLVYNPQWNHPDIQLLPCAIDCVFFFQTVVLYLNLTLKCNVTDLKSICIFSTLKVYCHLTPDAKTLFLIMNTMFTYKPFPSSFVLRLLWYGNFAPNPYSYDIKWHALKKDKNIEFSNS
jgi:hypothetical protein